MAVTVAALAVLAGAPAVVPTTTALEPPRPSALGPTVRETGEGPSGYQVTFRFDAPSAAEVSIVGDVYFTDPSHIGADMVHDARTGDEWRAGDVPHALFTQEPVSLAQGPDGVWEITMGLPAGVHSYGFVTGECGAAAFCESTFDPANPPVFADAPEASAQTLSQVYVPEHPEFPTDDASHLAPLGDGETAGEVRHVTYPSTQSPLPGGAHPLGVYLPPGWDPARAEPYPLLVLSHGADGNETSWFSQGAAAAILDHAIADGAMPPAVVVTTSFEGLTPAQMGEPAFLSAYAAELRDSVLPFVERSFHTSGDRQDRAFGGLSMGGALGLNLLAEHPDLFSSYGLWSAAADLGSASVAIPSDGELGRMSEARTIHLGTGLHDALQGIGDRSQERADLYAGLGLPVTTHDVSGGHTWHVWRQQLDDYVRGVAFAESPAPPRRQWGWIATLVVGVALTGVAIGAVRRGV
ncbi:alpha/beta hydrolase-fold protein [Demequina muriae]|uniref:Alpha/beta hydrolase-fold protein n=1 Tax=Demequina muriae TaxID=3051664 RepID=A0ABT8GJW6_9MICO|nr:alpha/beta hydrolase-fold protein [Demequina sp. EGI L300058]MDN4481725.1 alpha/beta hydrolase-fold protein [Demequina sp. EGI L300058]